LTAKEKWQCPAEVAVSEIELICSSAVHRGTRV
jgi:hypothetical protein